MSSREVLCPLDLIVQREIGRQAVSEVTKTHLFVCKRQTAEDWFQSTIFRPLSTHFSFISKHKIFIELIFDYLCRVWRSTINLPSRLSPAISSRNLFPSRRSQPLLITIRRKRSKPRFVPSTRNITTTKDKTVKNESISMERWTREKRVEILLMGWQAEDKIMNQRTTGSTSKSWPRSNLRDSAEYSNKNTYFSTIKWPYPARLSIVKPNLDFNQQTKTKWAESYQFNPKGNLWKIRKSS